MSKRRRGAGSIDLWPFQQEFRRQQEPYRRERLEYLKTVEPEGHGRPRDVLAWLDQVERAGEQAYAAVVADRLGWVKGLRDMTPDTTRVLRSLGLVSQLCRKSGRRSPRSRITMSSALSLLEGLHLDPIDVGI